MNILFKVINVIQGPSSKTSVNCNVHNASSNTNRYKIFNRYLAEVGIGNGGRVQCPPR